MRRPPKTYIQSSSEPGAEDPPMWRLMKRLAAWRPLFLTLSFFWPLIGVVMVLVPSYLFWAKGDGLGLAFTGVFALGAIWELFKLPLMRNVSLPAKFLWSVILGIPVLGILFFWISYRRPEQHSDETSYNSTGGYD